METPENKLQNNKIKAYYEESAQQRGDMDDYWAKGFYQSILVAEIFKLIRSLPGNKIMDIGCGDGRNVTFLSKRDKDVLGLDISFTRLKRTLNKTKKQQNKILLVQSYAEKLPVKSNSFDGVICTEVIEHIFDVESLYKEFYRILKNDGWLLISIPTVSLKKYFDMRHIRKPIYHDEHEHVREYTDVKIPWVNKKYFVSISKLIKALGFYNFKLYKYINIGFDPPFWLTNFILCNNIKKFIYTSNINKFLTKLPLINKFCVYKILLFKLSSPNIFIVH